MPIPIRHKENIALLFSERGEFIFFFFSHLDQISSLAKNTDVCPFKLKKMCHILDWITSIFFQVK